MNTKKGFTLVELLVVIAILAILATVSVVGYTSFITRAEQSNAQTEAHQVQTVIESALVVPNTVVKVPVKATEDAEATYIYLTMKNDVLTEVAEDSKAVDLTTDLGGLKGFLTYKTSNSKGTLTYNIKGGAAKSVVFDASITPKT